MSKLGDLLRGIREELGVNQAEMAALLGVDQTAVSKYEGNRILPSVEILLRLHGEVKSLEAQAKVKEALMERVHTFSKEDMGLLVQQLDQSQEVSDWVLMTKVLSRVVALRTRHWKFLKEVKELLKSHSVIDPVLCRLVALYRERGDSPAMRASFRKALNFLEVEAGRSEEIRKHRRQDH